MLLNSNISGEGKPLIVLHGFLGMSDNWKTLGNRFASEGYEAHLLDLRNHGRSFHTPDFSMGLMVQDLQQYCEAMGLLDIRVIGHSLGGKVAMLYADTFPQNMHKLVVVDIAPKYYPPHHQSILEGLQRLEMSGPSSRKEADTVLSSYVPDMGTRLFLLKNLYRKEKDHLALRLNLTALVQHIEEIGKALPDTAKYKGPSLFVKGASSNYILPEDYPLIKKHFPEAIIKTIPNAGHWVHAENPTGFYNLTSEFLTD